MVERLLHASVHPGEELRHLVEPWGPSAWSRLGASLVTTIEKMWPTHLQCASTWRSSREAE